jgi:hypothetical protein
MDRPNCSGDPFESSIDSQLFKVAGLWAAAMPETVTRAIVSVMPVRSSGPRKEGFSRSASQSRWKSAATLRAD